MATTQATISLRSSDLIPSQVLSLTSSKRLLKAGSASEGVDHLDMGRVDIVTGTSFDLIDATALGLGKNNYIYIANKSTSESNFITISHVNRTIIMGRLYGGDFAFFPWSAHDAAHDIEVTAFNGTSTIEYAVFHEGKTLISAS